MFKLFAGFSIALLAHAAFAGETPTLVDLVQPAGMTTARLSPDGKHLAVIGYSGTNHTLSLVDTSTLVGKTIVTGKQVLRGAYYYHKAPIDVTWAGNDLMAVDFGPDADLVDLDGKTVKNLGTEFIGRAQRGKPDSTQLLVYTDWDRDNIALCDAVTRKCSKFDRPRGTPLQWAFDKDGQLRAMTLLNSRMWSDSSTVSNWFLPGRGQEWVKLAEFKVTDDYWTPVYVPDEPDTIVIRSREGRDTYAFFNFDTKARKHGDMLVGHPTQDIMAVNGVDQDAFDYVVTGGMIPQQVWFDPKRAAVQRLVDTLLPKRINYVSGNPDGMLLIHSEADVDPGMWYLLDVPNKKLVEVLRTRISVDPAKMRPMEIMSYKAGDGLEIPAYLTRPADAKPNAPLVVLIHGGPHIRDTWEWDKEVQFLASRGYLVLQPQFRGSTGFGRKFEYAGRGQWGLAMQDDITAGVQDLVRKGIADPKRVCIVGASYGGYAALWGAVKTPDQYRCVVSFAGVSDIRHMFSDWSDTATDKEGRQHLLNLFGDPEKNAAAMDAVSPLRHASLIKAPVFLAHGRDDIRVPSSHSKQMKLALETYGKKVRWTEYPDEGHGLTYITHQGAYMTEMIEFIDENIGECAVNPAAQGCKAAK